MKKELEKILEDQKFVEKIISMETKEEAKKAIEEKGVSVTDEEMNEIHDLYSAIYEECKKMKKEDLMNVSGGVGGAIGAIRNFFVGAPTFTFCGFDVPKSTVADAIQAGAVGAFDTFMSFVKNRRAKNQAEIDLQNKLGRMREEEMAQAREQFELDKQKWEHNKNMQTAGLGAAALLAIVYMFRDDLKTGINKFGAWINS